MIRLTLALAVVLALGGCAHHMDSTSASSATTETGAAVTAAPPSATPATTPPKAAPTAPGAAAAKVHHLPSGLIYEDLEVGNGKMADPGLTVVVHYTGWLTDGTKFASSLDNNQPIEFTIGDGQMIRGWDEGVRGMRIGGKRKLTIPPDLAYGAAGKGGVIPPNATLVFEVMLLNVK